MKIATFVNENDEVTSLRRPGKFCVFEQVLGEWKNTTTIPLDLSDAGTITEARMRLKDAVVPFMECQAFLSAEIHGLWNLLLQESGFNTWKSEGSLFEQLDNVMASVAQTETAAVSADTDECENASCEHGRCGPQCASGHVGNRLDVRQFFVEDNKQKGTFQIDLASLLALKPEYTSREVLIPFLESGAFIRLEIRCSHVPRWFDKTIATEGLTARIESSGDIEHGDMLLVIVEPKTATG
jgi:Fe-only nitrogenase accessory protein AnfO